MLLLSFLNASMLTQAVDCGYSLTQMAFIAGCQQLKIPGSPDFTRPSICDCLERVFLLAQRQTREVA